MERRSGRKGGCARRKENQGFGEGPISPTRQCHSRKKSDDASSRTAITHDFSQQRYAAKKLKGIDAVSINESSQRQRLTKGEEPPALEGEFIHEIRISRTSTLEPNSVKLLNPLTLCSADKADKVNVKSSNDGGHPGGVAPSHDFRPHVRHEARPEDDPERTAVEDDPERTATPAREESTEAIERSQPMGGDREIEAHAQMNPTVSSSPLATNQRTDDGATEVAPAHHHHHQQQPHLQGGSEPCESPDVRTTEDHGEDTVIASPSNMPSEAPPLAERRTPTLRSADSPTDQPNDIVLTADHTPQAGEEQDAPAADDSSTSAADSSGSSSGSSASSSDSWYDDDPDDAAAGILEDFTEGVDSWLEDVHGAGREAFFGLFKRDATPQFCRPSLEVLGRHVSTTPIFAECDTAHRSYA